MKYYYILLALLIPLALIFSGCVSQKDTIKIGVALPLNGELAMYGNSGRAALEYASDSMGNEILGKKIEFIFEDSGCDAEKGSLAFNKLINVDKVQYIIGGICSSETLAGAPIAEANKVIVVSTNATSSKMKTAGEYIFTVYPLDEFEGKFAAEYIYNTLGKRKVAMLTCLSDWCEGLANTFTKNFVALGGKIVIAEKNEQDTSDLRTQLQKIKETNADMIFTVEYVKAISTLAVQKKELGIDLPIFAPTVIDQSLVDKYGTELEGAYTSKMTSKINNPKLESEIKIRSGMQNVDIEVTGARAYDILFLLKKSIENAGTFDTTKVKDTLLDINYDGIAGHYQFDSDGVPSTASYNVFEAIDGKLVQQN